MKNLIIGGLIELNVWRGNLPAELEVNFSQGCEKLQNVIFLNFDFKRLVFGVVNRLNDSLNGSWG